VNDTALAIVHPDYTRPGEGRGRDKEGEFRSSIMRGYCSMQRVEAITGMPYPRDMAIKAVALQRNKISNVRLNMLGEGEYLSELRKLVSYLDSGEVL